MMIQTIITAEGKAGVASKVDTIDTVTVDFLTNIWGFDQVPKWSASCLAGRA
jgi:hypothetical protein